MLPRPSALTIPDRPSKYLVVGDLTFRLPNEKRQFQLLRFVAGKVRAGGTLQVIGSLDALAAVLGCCWYHPTLSMEAPLPWVQGDAAARLASSAVLEGVLAPEEDPDDSDAKQDALDDARERAGQRARWDLLVEYGDLVLDELDDAGYGDRDTIGACFSELTKAMGRTFVPQEVVDARLGFSRPTQASSD